MQTHQPATRTATAGPPAAAVRAAGALLAAGSLAWGTAAAVYGTDTDEVVVPQEVTGIAYVIGLFALSWTLLATRATGARKGRFLPLPELALMPLAAAFNVYAITSLETYDDKLPAWAAVLDASWPLSQLYLLVLGIAVAVAGRWRGLLRWHPLACALWFIATVAVQAAFGKDASAWTGAAWLLLVFTSLGLRLALRPADALTTAAPTTGEQRGGGADPR
ncbi:hypothetical protein [Actinomadura parmotrematis]|uniref:Tryptophan-rich sensory protein n=1 Tax=Actinomadura parmotrematis TaxID=2864039 RepID=A0ABS7FT66_9ACTN|nr:hypothetical protein [Actinomadura parmotrematis]MBW8482738.1 hypothetical protein [Actinomadura parmotrematis]